MITVADDDFLDYSAFCISLYELMKPVLSMSLEVFMQLPVAEQAYRSGKTPEKLAMDTIKLTKFRMRQAQKQTQKAPK